MNNQKLASRALVDQVMARYSVGPHKAMKIIAKAEKHMTRQTAMSRGIDGHRADPATIALGRILDQTTTRTETVTA